jgi:hypothetical protein
VPMSEVPPVNPVQGFLIPNPSALAEEAKKYFGPLPAPGWACIAFRLQTLTKGMVSVTI